MLKRLGLTALLLAPLPVHAGTIIIENDLGGMPDVYAEKTLRKLPMEIRGNCYSACTIYLGNPNACFDRDAVLYFHASSFDYAKQAPVKTRKPTRVEREATDYWVTPHYPPKVKQWIKKHGGLKVTIADMLVLKGKELHRMARICDIKEPRKHFAAAKVGDMAQVIMGDGSGLPTRKLPGF